MICRSARLLVFSAIGLAAVLHPSSLRAADRGKAGSDGDLVGHWKLDELSPDKRTTPDASPSKRGGRVHGQALAEGVIGRAMEFHGFDQTVELGDLETSAPATVSFWVRTRDLIHDRRLLAHVDGPTTQGGSLRLDACRLEVWNGARWEALIDDGLRFDAWMHIAVVFSEKGQAFGYLNGQAKRAVPCGFDFAGVQAAIGARSQGEYGNAFTGWIDDFRLYKRALTTDEARGIYEAAAPEAEKPARAASSQGRRGTPRNAAAPRANGQAEGSRSDE
ncbi:MAG TPA: LamG domain-containing protein [Sumerlaeia bacterium]|nr:LamG domain-containing protein [Sumerlaeia bacterium]